VATVPFTNQVAQGATFQTTITPDSPLTGYSNLGNGSIARIEYRWATNVTSGTITESDLTEWEIELFDTANNSAGVDNVVDGGNVQPIGGVFRSISFEADVDIPQFQFADNDLFQSQSTGMGVTFNIIDMGPGSEGGVSIVEFNNGTFLNEDFNSAAYQTTTAVPFHTDTLPGLIAMGGLIFWRYRRQKRKAD
jgi:hypothetical protein